jgi:hypothetical protein
MTGSEFENELARLVRDFGGTDQNRGSYHSDRCISSMRCTFCKDCRDCYQCTHCEDCQATTASGHCIRCTGCHDCSHCEDSRGCTHSAYLVQCSFCNDCDYCLGCVGLNDKEFHILNRPYPRSEYFALAKAILGQ